MPESHLDSQGAINLKNFNNKPEYHKTWTKTLEDKALITEDFGGIRRELEGTELRC